MRTLVLVRRYGQAAWVCGLLLFLLVLGNKDSVGADLPTETPTTTIWTYPRTGNVRLSDYGVDIFDLSLQKTMHDSGPLVMSGRSYAHGEYMVEATTVEIQGEIGDVTPVYETTLTDAERQMLAKLTFAEAGNQDAIGKQLVVDVVLNRRAKSKWPDTIEGVIFQSGQFSTITDGAYARAAAADLTACYAAIEQECKTRIDYGIVYFNSGPTCVNGVYAWKHQDHWFAY